MSARAPIRVLSVDDHPLLQEGIAAMIKNQPDIVLVADASTGPTSRSWISAFRT